MRFVPPSFLRLVAPAAIRRDTTTFLTIDGRFEVNMPAGLARKLVERADGGLSLRAIAEEVGGGGQRSRAIEALLARLVAAGVLVDCVDSTPFALRLMADATAWAKELPRCPAWPHPALDESLQAPPSGRSSLLEARSRKWFGQPAWLESAGEGKLDRVALGALLWAAYGALPHDADGLPVRTVPSPASLYPLVLHLIVRRGGALKGGVYRVTSTEPGKVEATFVRGVKAGQVLDCFRDSRAAERSAAILVISASLPRSARVFGTRGLLLSLLEAGHVAQNVHLAASLEGLATKELVSLSDAGLAGVLRLARTAAVPLLAITLDPKGPHRSPAPALGAPRRFDAKLWGSRVRVVRVPIYTSPEWPAVEAGEGFSTTAREADLKARAEAVERLACFRGHDHKLQRARYVDLPPDSTVDPRSMYRFLRDQPVRRFDTRKERWWRCVRSELDGKTRLVLADLVYIRFAHPRESYAFGNSSGAAAHVTREAALENGFLELVERDAFMVTWANRLRRPTVRERTLPAFAQKRIKAIERSGFAVRVVDLTFDLAPVFLVSILRLDGSAYISGAACHFDAEHALEHAVFEAEKMLLAHTLVDRELVRAPTEVASPGDHGRYYYRRASARRARFLMGDPRREIDFARVGSGGVHGMVEARAAVERLGMDLLVADLDEGDKVIQEYGFRVVKVIVPGLVPIMFGPGRVPWGLERVRSLPVKCGFLRRPIDVPRLNRDPHPFP